MASITMRVRFKKICDGAGLSGRHLHLHSLRHSYAHMLLKCGNSVSVISKLLNHSCTDVTEKFYLRETISEVTNRAHIPWINQNEKTEDKILPDFLKRRENKTSHKMKRLECLSIMCAEEKCI
jgi:integrase